MAPKTVQIQDIQDDINEFISLVKTGVEVVLIEDGKEIAKVVPSKAPKNVRVAGLHKGSIIMSDDFDEPLGDKFWLGAE